METLEFNIQIKSSARKVWQVLWNDMTYRKWTSVFKEGSYAVSDWKEGSKVHFLTPEGDGMFSIIETSKPAELMIFRHQGLIKNKEEQAESEETKSWQGSKESYYLNEENGTTSLTAKLDSSPEFLEYFKDIFPKALELIKQLAENPIVLTIETTVNAPVDKIWKYWTLPEYITQWNAASEDWHTPLAENDLKAGGQFTYRMEAKDGSFGFDFGGIYTEVEINKKIKYTLGDGRKVSVNFMNQNDSVKIVESFEAEPMNPLEMQQFGWQAILNNFKKFTESH